MDGLRRGTAAIVGVAKSDLGVIARQMTAIHLMAQGVQRALADRGLELRDVDGSLCATAQGRTSGLPLAEYRGISPPLSTARSSAGRLSCFTSPTRGQRSSSYCARLQSSPKLDPTRNRAATGPGARVQPLRDTIPALTTVDRLCADGGASCPRIRHDAPAIGGGRDGGPRMGTLKPSRLREEAADEKVLAARMVSYPLTVRGYCLITHGGGVVIMTTSKRARSLKKPPVYSTFKKY